LTQALLRRWAVNQRLRSIVLFNSLSKNHIGSDFVMQGYLCLTPLIFVSLSKLRAEVAMALSILLVLRRKVGIILFDKVSKCIPTTTSDGLGGSSCSSCRSLLLLLCTRRSLGVHGL
jgi:hypothetical protein